MQWNWMIGSWAPTSSIPSSGTLSNRLLSAILLLLLLLLPVLPRQFLLTVNNNYSSSNNTTLLILTLSANTLTPFPLPSLVLKTRSILSKFHHIRFSLSNILRRYFVSCGHRFMCTCVFIYIYIYLFVYVQRFYARRGVFSLHLDDVFFILF